MKRPRLPKAQQLVQLKRTSSNSSSSNDNNNNKINIKSRAVRILRTIWLAQTLCSSLLALHTIQPLIIQVSGLQQATSSSQADQQQLAGTNNQEQHSNNQQAAALIGAGIDNGAISALESSAALANDDLIAAESSLGADSGANGAVAEHKTFTNAQVVRQENPQMPAVSVAPSQVQFASPQPQIAQAQQPPQHPMNQQQHQQQPMFNMQQQQHHPPAHMAIQSRIAPHQPKAFNPFMAALAGNYGPAQQQIAAAAAAGLQHAQHPQQQQHMHPQQQQQQQHSPPHHFPIHAHPQMMGPPAQQQAQQQQPVQHQMQSAAVMQPHPQQQVSAHNQQLVRQQVAAAVVPAPEQAALAVQESSVRSNIVPAPNFNSIIDTNTIEMNNEPQQQQQQSQQSSSSSGGLTAAASVQQPMTASAPVASVSSQMQEAASNAWPLQAPDIPKIVNLEVKCEKNLMKVSIEFDKVFNGVIFSKGHYNQGQCVHVNQNSGRQQAYFDISINSCGTQGNTQNGLYGMGGNTGSGTYFENTIVVQYDPNVQEVYDHARKLRCTWHDQYEKAVTFRPFPVDMLDIVRADFAGDNVGCWMQIQVGKGPWASEVAGIVKIGQTMTMVLAIKDEENKFDMLVRNCFAHDGKRGPIELVDKSGCITRPKLMSRFTKIKNFGSSATVLSYAHFQAFKFPDSMEVHFQCTIQICRHQCPDQCSSSSTNGGALGSGGGASNGEAYSESTISGTLNIHGANQAAASGTVESTHLRKYGVASALTRERRDLSHQQLLHHNHHWNGSQPVNGRQLFNLKPMTQTVGLNRVIQVVSTGDLAFAFNQQQQQQQTVNGSFGDNNPSEQSNNNNLASEQSQLTRVVDLSQQICMSSFNFVLSLVVLVLILLCSSLIAVSLYVRQKNYAKRSNKLLVPSPSATNYHHHHHQQQQQLTQQQQLASPSASSCSLSSANSSTLRQQTTTNNVPQQQQHLYQHHRSNHHHNLPHY